jgi:hypothetical protein
VAGSDGAVRRDFRSFVCSLGVVVLLFIDVYYY